MVSQRTTVKYYQRDGSAVGYTVVAFAGGAVDRWVEFESYSVDVGMPSPGFVGRPLENLTPGYMAEIEFRPKVTVFSVPTEESRTPDYTMFGMLQRLRKAAGEYGALIPPNLVRNAAATDAFVEDLRGLYQLGEMACTPMRAKNSPLFSNEALVREISSAIANWEITMAGIQQQMESSAYAYWDSLSGRTDPWDAYRMEGVAGYHIASFFVPGWVVKGVGKIGLVGRLTLAEQMAILRLAKEGVKDFSLGLAKYDDAIILGRAWVGEGFTVASDGTTLVSADKLKQFRPPSLKNSPFASTGVQANFEWRANPSGRWLGNGHLNIIP